MQNLDPRGLLESDNVYIAEYLMQKADAIKPDVFFRRFQAGFSLSYSEPSFGVCGCNTTEDVCNFVAHLRPSTGQCPRYSIDQQCALSWAACYASPQSCRAIMEHCLLFNRSLDTFQSETMSNCSTVDVSFTDIHEVCKFQF